MSRLPNIAAALLCGGAAVAQTVTTVINNGTTQSRYDIVILGDGYQAAEEPQFDQDVLTFLAALFQHQPYQTFASYFNVHTVFRASVDSGADHPDETPPLFRNTAYDSTYNYGGTDRCLYIQNTSLALADAALAPATEGRVLVMVNDSRYGGCAATFAVSYTGASMTEVQTHEIGHSLGLLADEYDYPYNNYTGGEPSQVNITTSPIGQKWSIWQGTDSISAFEGAGYYLHGLYRPKLNCLMRTLGITLCRVCQENIVKVTNSIVHTIVSTSPATSNVTVDVPNIQPFSFSHIVPAGNNPLITWQLDGQPIAGVSGASYNLDSTALTLGSHTLAASVKDQTLLVRTDPNNVMTESFTWQVTVADPTAAQLHLTAMSSNSLYGLPGGALTINTTVVNDGPAAAGPFDVDFFLSSTNTWTPQSTYLGKVAVAGLSVTQSLNLQHPTQLPWSLQPNLHYLIAVADRVDVVHEGNETDNERWTILLGNTGACSTKLEYQDPLLYPADSGTLSVSAGGVLHPTVVAPCANPTSTLYLIAWGSSGTSPGLTLGPGLVLPLNPDNFTSIGLDGLNGPVFGAFLGVLDAEGQGHATFTLPAIPTLPTLQTHFAAVLLGTTQLFTDVSNAIGLTLDP